MNETKRNKIKKVCDSLTLKEAIELCEKLMIENEELKEVNSYYGFIADVAFGILRENCGQCFCTRNKNA